MTGAVERTRASSSRWELATRTLRVLAWLALLGASGMLARSEVRRADWPEGVIAYTDVVYRRTPDGRLRMDIYVPEDLSPTPKRRHPTVLAIHGGGWRGGSRISYGWMAARLAQHGYVVASADYTLARPGKPSWPDCLDDLRAAVHWLRRNAEQYGIDRDRIVVMGASAGGHLAVLLGTLNDDDPSLGVRGVIDFYGPTDLRRLAEETPVSAAPIAEFLGGTPGQVPDRYHDASPVFRVTPTCPPMILLHGADDPHVPIEQSKLLAEALAQHGVPHRLVEIPRARHGFDVRIDGHHDLLPEILDFFANVGEAKGTRPSVEPSVPTKAASELHR